jgi:predicted kinase
LAAGQAVIADAMFSQPADRDAISSVAQRAACPFKGIWLDLQDNGRIARVRSRAPDASDADERVAMAQSASHPLPPTTWDVIETAGEIAAVVRRAQELLGLPVL